MSVLEMTIRQIVAEELSRGGHGRAGHYAPSVVVGHFAGTSPFGTAVGGGDIFIAKFAP